MSSRSPLEEARLKYQPHLPLALQEIRTLVAVPDESYPNKNFAESLENLFPHTVHQPRLRFAPQNKGNSSHQPLRVGVVLSGGQAPGGHNVITGLFDGLKQLHEGSKLFGFKGGPSGIVENCTVELTAPLLASYRNQGGFDLIGSGRTKLDTPEQLKAAAATAQALDLDCIVVIGGDDSNTNASILAEYFKDIKSKTTVVGAPKTIDGDLKTADIEVSFGFDSASKTFASIIGNVLRDCLSAKKYYYFIKLMGRSASHVTLECALQTHPNMALISEEIAAKEMTLQGITGEICDMICARAQIKKNYGVILIPEGVIEFVPEVKELIADLNSLLAGDQPHGHALEKMSSLDEKLRYLSHLLKGHVLSVLKALPENIQSQLLLDRDPHGNVEVSKIETERMFIELVGQELKRRQQAGTYDGKFSAQPHFCGYEGRSCLPSNFDSDYCYSLGHVAALLAEARATGYMCCVKNLIKAPLDWEIAGIPLVSMMEIEQRHGKSKPVIVKALVDLEGKPFQAFAEERDQWMLDDCYRYPGPIQFFGESIISDAVTISLQLEQQQDAIKIGKMERLEEIGVTR